MRTRGSTYSRAKHSYYPKPNPKEHLASLRKKDVREATTLRRPQNWGVLKPKLQKVMDSDAPLYMKAAAILVGGLMVGGGVLGMGDDDDDIDTDRVDPKIFRKESPLEAAVESAEVVDAGRGSEAFPITNADDNYRPSVSDDSAVFVKQVGDNKKIIEYDIGSRTFKTVYETSNVIWDLEADDNYIAWSESESIRDPGEVKAYDRRDKSIDDVSGAGTYFDLDEGKIASFYYDWANGEEYYKRVRIDDLDTDNTKHTPRRNLIDADDDWHVDVVLDGDEVAWADFSENVYVVQDWVDDDEIEVESAEDYPWEFGYSEGVLYSTYGDDNNLRAVEVSSGDETYEGDISDISDFKAKDGKVLCETQDGLFLFDSGNVRKISEGAYGYDISEDNVVWEEGQNVKLLDLSGNAVPPELFRWLPQHLQLVEASQLQYDPDNPAKFVLDAMFGSDLDLKFNYIQSGVTINNLAERNINSLELVLETEGGGTNIVQMQKTGDKSYFTQVIKSTDSTVGNIANGFLVDMSMTGDPQTAAITGTITGTLENVMTEWPDVYVTKAIVNGQEVDIADKKLSSIVNDPNIWNSKTREFIVASPVDLEVLLNGKRANEATNAVYSGADKHPEFVVFFDPAAGDYKAKIRGDGSGGGAYSFVEREVEGETVRFQYVKEDVKIKDGEVHTDGVPPNESTARSFNPLYLLGAIPILALGGGAYLFRNPEHMKNIRGRFDILVGSTLTPKAPVGKSIDEQVLDELVKEEKKDSIEEEVLKELLNSERVDSAKKLEKDIKAWEAERREWERAKQKIRNT